MDPRNGRIYTPEEQEALMEALRKNQDKATEQLLGRLKRMDVPPTEKQMARRPPKVGRNEPCPCGSGKKFKHCCLNAQRR